MKKEFRLKIIKQLVLEQEIETQEELQHILFKKGISVTQATISRDIHSLHLIKVQTKDGSYKYSSNTPKGHLILHKLKSKLIDDLVSIEVTHYLVLLKTLPGNAPSFGALFDLMEIGGKIGTICGNDTCLIICRSREDAIRIKEQMEGLINELD